MIPGVRRLVAVTAQSVGPSAVVDAPPAVRAAASFVLVLLFGGALLYRYGAFVDRSVDSSKERPLLSVVYGAIGYGLVGFFCLYAYTQLFRLGLGGAVLSTIGVVVVACIALVLAGLGFLVVGTLLTELNGHRQPWSGLVVGAVVSAIAWLALPLLGSVVAWFVVTAIGIGGPTRRWVHASRAERVRAEQ
jgi:hypothetical protein